MVTFTKTAYECNLIKKDHESINTTVKRIKNQIQEGANPEQKLRMGDSPLQAVTNYFLKVVGNQITETQEVIFDITQGDEGMETPPPNDFLKASLHQSPLFFQNTLAKK